MEKKISNDLNNGKLDNPFSFLGLTEQEYREGMARFRATVAENKRRAAEITSKENQLSR